MSNVASDAAPRRVMLVAGEASGDTLAAELVAALRSLAPGPLEFFGAGGPRLAAAGADLAFDLTRHSVIGLVEALKKLGEFRRLGAELVALALARRPDVIVCIDFSGFNRRLAAAIREAVRKDPSAAGWRPRIVQFVSPQVWASRPGRARSMARDFDLLLAIFPFEPEWYRRRVPELRVEFVGHPMVDRHAARREERSVQPAAGPPVVLLLPGSRVGELRRHLPVMIEAGKRVAGALPVRFLTVLPDENLASMARPLLAALPGVTIQIGDLAGALRSATVALASTGTVTMECAFFGVPTVAFYRTSWSTYQIARRIITVHFLAMPNVLADRRVFPEFVQGDASAANLANALLDLLQHPERRRWVREQLVGIIESLGGPGATTRAAKAILGLFPTPPPR